jgi:hypothetical protein
MKKKLIGIFIVTLLIVTAVSPLLTVAKSKKTDIEVVEKEEKPESYKPSAREAHDMVYDRIHGKIIMFGGRDVEGNYFDDTWVYDYYENTWTNMNPSRKPSPRAFHAMAYDHVHDITLLYGGYLENGDIDNELWIYDYAANTWTLTDTWRYKLFGHEICYDPHNDQFVIYGGYDADSGLSRRTICYDYANNWINSIFRDSPPERYLFSMVYNNHERGTFVFGGGILILSLSDDLYYFKSHPDWVWMEPDDFSAPSPRFGHDMVYDSDNFRIILFGGADFNNFMDDTWKGEGTGHFFDWREMNPSAKPSARWLHSMVYDIGNKKTILFGGNTINEVQNDLWFYDYASNTWIEIHPKAKPHINTPFLKFLENHPILYQLLQRVLRL